MLYAVLITQSYAGHSKIRESLEKDNEEDQEHGKILIWETVRHTKKMKKERYTIINAI